MSTLLSPAKSPVGGAVPKLVRLLNAVVDVCVVFGFDETCARELEPPEDGNVDLYLDGLMQRDLKLHFLQILAPGQVYPDRSAPPTSDPPPPQNTLNSSVEEVMPMPAPSSHSKKFNVTNLGLSWETVESMHFFFFPEGAKISRSDLEPSVIPMLFTNLFGEHSFAVGLRLTRPFFIHKPAGHRNFTLLPWESTPQPPEGSKLVYMPMCCVLLSKKPYFRFMKDVLSGFYNVLTNEAEDTEFWSALQDYMERVFLIPSPPPGQLAVVCQLPGFSSHLVVRPPRGGEYLDIRLHYPFLCLSVENVLQVVCALLTEQRLVFSSSLHPMLTYVIQCFFSYISPLRWRYSVVPILPLCLLEYLEAPVTIIMGCHSQQTSAREFQDIENAVIVDLDSDTVTVMLQDHPSLPSLPSAATDTFKQRYEQLQKKSFFIEEMTRLSHLSAEELERDREDFNRSRDDMLSKMFLELMVNLYGRVTDQLKQSRVKYEEAVREMPIEDQQFYRMATTTDMFTAFYQSRRSGIRDEFTLLAEKLKRLHRRNVLDEEPPLSSLLTSQRHSITPLMPFTPLTTLTPLTPSSPGRLRHYITMPVNRGPSSSISLSTGQLSPPMLEDPHIMANSSLATPTPTQTTPTGILATPPSDLVWFELPSLAKKDRDRELFISAVIKTLSELVQNKAVQAQCVYLRAFYKICWREFSSALDDFYVTLERLEVQLVPDSNTVHELISILSSQELCALECKSYYKLLTTTKKKSVTQLSRQPSAKIINVEKKMPNKALSLNEFLKIVQENAIATDAESATILHRVLSEGRTTTISPDIFRNFYEAWKVLLHENASVELPGYELERGGKGVPCEKILASVSPVRTNFGTQNQLVLTTYRLLAVSGFKTHVMADLKGEIRFEKFSYQNIALVGTKMPGVRVERLGSKADTKERLEGRATKTRSAPRSSQGDIFMAFQDALDREHWYHMAVEIQQGWKLAGVRKETGIMETAECHVLLQSAINQSTLLDRCNFAQRMKTALKLLSLQVKDVSELGKFTVEALQYRINPCLHETERQTVESLLYIPPLDPYEGGQGKLWIGLGNGRLKVYDMAEKCFESDIKITESKHGKSVRLSCLLLVGPHVWVGSFSRNIHILDAETVCHVSQLSYLEDAPRDLALSQSGPVLVWSLLLNGLLLAWDPDTRTRVVKMQVPISEGHSSLAWNTCTCFTIWRDYIWVGTNRGSIAVMDTQERCCVKEITIPAGGKRQVEIKHLALSSEDEVWCSAYAVPRSEDSAFISVFDPSSHQQKLKYSKLDNRVSIILPVSDTMWCGAKSGKIYIFHSKSYADGKGMPKILRAHDDFIRTMTMTDINLVVSGSGSNDGYAAVWKTIELP